MNIRKTMYLSLLFICVALYNYTPLAAQEPPMMLPPEDQKMLAELDKEINGFVDSLPPEQQKQFWKDVEELTDVMSKMEPQELDEFIQGVFSGDITELPIERPEEPTKPLPKPQPKPAPVPKPEKKTIIEKPTELPEIKEATQTLDLVIDQIETFLRKMQIIPEIESKLAKWTKANIIRAWQEGTTWNQRKTQIEVLVQKLYKVKDRDSKTKEYKYMNILVKNKGLINNLKQLGTVLQQYISQIEAPEFGQTSLSKQSRKAIQEVVSILSEALTLVAIPKELDAVFEGYSFVSEQLRAQEEAARETALKEEIRSTVRPISPYRPNYAYDYDKDTYDYSGYPADVYQRPIARPYIPSPGTSTRPTRPTVRPDAPEKAGKPTPEKPKPGEPKKPKPGEKKPEEEKKVEIDAAAESYLDEIIDNIEKATDLIDDYEATLKNIKAHLTDVKPVNQEVALINLPQTIKSIRSAIDKVRALKRRVGRMEDDKQKQKYRDALKEKKLREKFDTLETLSKDIKSAKDQWNNLANRVAPDKQYAYIGGINADNASDAIKNAITSPSSIYTLQMVLEKMFDAIDELEKKPKRGMKLPGR